MSLDRFAPLLALVFVASGGLYAEQAKRPNVVFILADDLGYGELGCYGQKKIRTPNIDRLATQGVRFTQHYSGAPVCAPARCTLMTGRHGAHAEVRNNRGAGGGRLFPGEWPLTAEAVTVAEVLKSRGYKTGTFGKWGLGGAGNSGSSLRQGFDRFYGYNDQRHAHGYFPQFLVSNEREVLINPFPIPGHFAQPKGPVRAADYRSKNYAPDLIVKEALKFLDKHRGDPFFLYLPFVEPHLAMQPPTEWVERYPREWDEGHGPYRGQNGYLPHPRPRAAYAAMISDLDEHVGLVLERLEKQGLTENTIVVFTSDNGPTHGGRDPQFQAGGAATKFFHSNGKLRGYKGSCYEGGIRVPCVVRWPGRVAPGTQNHSPSYFPDWMPTLAGLTDTPLPDGLRHDGIDLTAAIKGGQQLDRPEPMFWEFGGYGGMAAVREGPWKALRRQLKRKNPAPWELYHLDNDSGETKNLAEQHPEIVRRLEKAYMETRTVEPDFPLPIYDRKTAAR